MPDEVYLIAEFAKMLNKADINRLKELCSNQLQFFNPLFGYLKSEQVHTFWELQKANGVQINELVRPNDLGDGYYKLLGKLIFLSVHNAANSIPVQLHIRIENKKITEYSEAFSLHKMAQIQNPFWGWLLGWNKYYQNRMKIKARRELFQMLEE
jgi:hypothetical protein